MSGRSTERLSGSELTCILSVLGGGTVASYYIFDFYDTALLAAKFVLLLLSFSISVAGFYGSLSLSGAPVGRRLAGSLWGALPWNSLQLWQLAYVGYFFLPVEIMFSGLLVSFRSGISVWRAMMFSTAVRAACLLFYLSARVEVIGFLRGEP